MIASVLLFLVGAALALAIPDIDQRIPFLVHRSLLTHGMLLPLLAFLLAYLARFSPVARAGAIGVCVATAAHLAFDLFPQLWLGYALVHAPVLGRLPATMSIVWLAASLLVCCYAALVLVRSTTELVLAAGGLAVIFLVLAPAESAFWGPLVALAAGVALALAMPDRLPTLRRIARRG
jgi:hypothetical protein